MSVIYVHRLSIASTSLHDTIIPHYLSTHLNVFQHYLFSPKQTDISMERSLNSMTYLNYSWDKVNCLLRISIRDVSFCLSFYCKIVITQVDRLGVIYCLKTQKTSHFQHNNIIKTQKTSHFLHNNIIIRKFKQ
jgi:hypothetical protein